MKAVTPGNLHFTPWHLRERTRGLRNELTRTIQSNFFYSFLFLPKEKRDAIIDVYNFCRMIDDIVDDSAEDVLYIRERARAELQKWRKELINLYAGNPVNQETRKLMRVLQRFPIPKEYFDELINGCEMDLRHRRYRTFTELYQYCFRVASITGLICIEVFTYRSPQSKSYAINLGIALQLINILRDLKEDATRGRVYLPEEDLHSFGYSIDDLSQGVINGNFIELMKFECERARFYYRLASTYLPQEDRSTMTAAITMGRIYYRLLEQIEQSNYDVFNNRIRLHRPERFYIALSEWVRGGLGVGE
jgi:15-cis-phytoene synthase